MPILREEHTQDTKQIRTKENLASISNDSSTFGLSETSCWHHCAGVPRGRAVMLHHLHQALRLRVPPMKPLTWAERGGRTLLYALSGEFIRVSRAAPGWRKVEGRRRGVQVRIVAARGRAGWQVPPYGEVGGKLGRERGSGWVRLGAGAGCSGCPGGSQGDWVGG